METYQTGRLSFLGNAPAGPWFFRSSQAWLLPGSGPGFPPDPLSQHLGPLSFSPALGPPFCDLWFCLRLRGCFPVASCPYLRVRQGLHSGLLWSLLGAEFPVGKLCPWNWKDHGIQSSRCGGRSGFLSCAVSVTPSRVLILIHKKKTASLMLTDACMRLLV